MLFINQTPHRWSPVETHTTGLPLINYLPARLALRAASRSRRTRGASDWSALLRAGIRGATVREIMAILGPQAKLLAPRRGDQIDLWLGKLSPRYRGIKWGVWAALKGLQATTGVCLTPELSLAITRLP